MTCCRIPLPSFCKLPVGHTDLVRAVCKGTDAAAISPRLPGSLSLSLARRGIYG